MTRLDDAGHLDREPDPTDRRRNLVTLTKAGSRRLKEIQHAADQAQDELLVGLSPHEREQLHALLAKVLAAHRPEPA